MATPSPTEDEQLRQIPHAAAPQSPTGDEGRPRLDVPAVRFSSAVEEIFPSATMAQPGALNHGSHKVSPDQLRALTKTLHGSPLQERRINTYQFEAFSLPPSRVPSREDASSECTRHPTPNSDRPSPHGSPRLSALASPPLTPAGSEPSATGERHHGGKGSGDRGIITHEPPGITPQPTSSHDRLPVVAERRPLNAHRPASSNHILRRASSADNHKAHRRGLFSIGPGSTPSSRDSSPSRSSASHFYSKPITPGGDANDPYAKGRRPPQQQHPNRHSIDPRFVFPRKQKRGSPGGSRSSLAERRASGLFGAKTGGDGHVSDGGPGGGQQHGSMADLKRFFRKSASSSNKKRDASPAPIKAASKTPPGLRSSQQLPFSDDHSLTSKYGKLGKVLGSGAGGSVRLMRRKNDGTVFAVKEFRARHTYESEKEYNKKVTAEFCVGSTLHHGNIIETLDILQEKGRWFEVMEYAPYDLFAIVMTGSMSREEIRCSFLQILNGVTYLHSVGLAHRDLKLDNVVVSDRGIMKIIDFGSAHVFKYPFENDTVPAKGIVGSDPYLAPEVYDAKESDAAAADVWSLAIIFCCMTLRRFPWKIPRMTDNSYKLFAADPSPGHDPNGLLRSPDHSAASLSRDPGADDVGKEKSHYHSHRRSSQHKREGTEVASNHGDGQAQQTANTGADRKEAIRGPWRILRLLPRESRRITHRMLDLDPNTRAGMDEILQEPWVADTVICQQFDNGEVISAEDHTHVLEPPASQQAPQKA
ncbi:Serine/Threonine protein kinase [Ophiocordyceps sinensis CO18]|uniref:non-specific serine/threonine protein kinase n=1 Tax=Ophiocordyceps sinensis (strain Co18 / CGMCC 3.14243) TaxID=911162 RepID=T5A9I1_OPHSC|nr:Serine/Threonine protein kinase [Ophiocordyceps sinensis CO18]